MKSFKETEEFIVETNKKLWPYHALAIKAKEAYNPGVVTISRSFLENGDLLARLYWPKYKIGDPIPKPFKDHVKIEKANAALVPAMKIALDNMKPEKVEECINVASHYTNSEAFEWAQTFGISPAFTIIMYKFISSLWQAYQDRNYQPAKVGS